MTNNSIDLYSSHVIILNLENISGDIPIPFQLSMQSKMRGRENLWLSREY